MTSDKKRSEMLHKSTDPVTSCVSEEIETVVFGEIVPVKDHTHLHWTCPFCGSPGLAGESITTLRVICSVTDRGFLVVGIASDPRITVYQIIPTRKYRR
jgi:hypothetical protein